MGASQLLCKPLRGAHTGLQVPRILNPVVLVLDALPKHCKDPKLASYVNSVFGSVEGCRKAVLLDFFRHAFDGSGADNFVSLLCTLMHPAAFHLYRCAQGRLMSSTVALSLVDIACMPC